MLKDATDLLTRDFTSSDEGISNKLVTLGDQTQKG